MKFSEWLHEKYNQWNRLFGGEKNYNDFAEYLDIPATSLSNWLNAGYKPRGENISKLAGKYPDVYQALGMPQPAPAFTSIPELFAQTIYEAIERAGYQIREQHIDPQSKEAERIIITVFKEHGFTYEKPNKGK